MLSALVAHGISIEHMPTGIDTLSVIICQKDLAGRRREVIDDIIAACDPDSVEVHEDMALIAVVGRGMINRVGTSAKVFTALAEHGVNVRMIDQAPADQHHHQDRGRRVRSRGQRHLFRVPLRIAKWYNRVWEHRLPKKAKRPR